MRQPILLGASAFPLEAFLSSRIYSSLRSGVLAAEVRQIPRAIALALCLLLATSCEPQGITVVGLPLGRQRVTDLVQGFRDLITARERQMQRMAQALFDEFVRPGLGGRAPKELLIELIGEAR